MVRVYPVAAKKAIPYQSFSKIKSNKKGKICEIMLFKKYCSRRA